MRMPRCALKTYKGIGVFDEIAEGENGIVDDDV